MLFWKMASRSTPELSAVMLRLYAAPVHTASVERCSSTLRSMHIKHATNIAQVRSLYHCIITVLFRCHMISQTPALVLSDTSQMEDMLESSSMDAILSALHPSQNNMCDFHEQL